MGSRAAAVVAAAPRVVCGRCFSSGPPDPTGVAAAARLARILSENAKPVRVKTSDIRVLRTPSEFHECLASGISSARDKVVVSTLYIGQTTEKERGLVELLAAAKRRGTRVSLLLDALRARRSEGSKTIAKTLASSLLEPGGGEPPQVSLYHTPRLKGLLKSVVKPPYSEIMGVCHMKVYVFDDAVLMSGANLNERYFTNRQDRYVSFKSAELASRVCDIIDAVGKHSYQLDRSGGLEAPPSGFDPVSSPKAFSENLQMDLAKALEPVGDRKTDALDGLGDHALVFPLVQLGCINYRQDEKVMLSFLDALRSMGSAQGVPGTQNIVMSSGYLNVTKKLEKALLQADSSVQFVTASPRANGFYKSSNSSKALIPFVYQNLTNDLVRRMKASSGREINLHEYERPDWQYHAKGLWYFPTSGSNPVATFIGSPNYGYRSAEKDLEMQFAVVSACQDLGERLKGEAEALLEHSIQKSSLDDSEARLFVSLSSKLCRKWL
ncbi:phospholipase [Chloropicon primus]|uniref:CDP-diacylglycerol--glycerol-3-phosphate 3-phosphatidyltransferase n=1 Tax=Chloropicon primus TaxID=1764295 RepID=A0A5B8MHJ6_9CHLO|nr:phospholipase [Chloropicon primus]UPQ99157.1 phospholipase [Chloropicon primus]|mmetsp:Transcript_6512/g.19253  ORF Transcript_6512/g.19253 Transcript_6512/m.19253 type:complete len:495 (+) Transcript_6512:284-1768(+)|eukprot:QDZ19946.1 phospholipase [Chloropicon primus]